MSEAVLAIDAGNTVVRFGAATGGELVATWEVSTSSVQTADEAVFALDGFYRAFEGGLARIEPGGAAQLGCCARPNSSIVSSVVPSLTDVWVEAAARFCGARPLVVGPGLKTGLKMTYRDPGEVGSDRVADMVAAKEIYGAPCLVVDLGTTTNIEVLDEGGAFAGGIIAPGLRLSAEAVSQCAARLPVVEVKAPASIVGRSTREAMQAGIVMGEVARIDGLIDMVFAELGYTAPVVVSGRDAAALAALVTHDVLVDESLTLKGLVSLHTRNKG